MTTSLYQMTMTASAWSCTIWHDAQHMHIAQACYASIARLIMHCCGNYKVSHAANVHKISSWLCIDSGRYADLGSAVALEHLEQHSCAQAEGEAYHQASSKDVQEPGKDS